MSYLKLSSDLFLEKAELNRFKQFLDDDGFRKFMVNSSVRYGLVKRQYVIDDSVSNSFNNALVTEDTGLTIKHNAILCIDSDGYFIVTSEQTQISIPDTETWYWVKIYHSYSSKEISSQVLKL